MTSSNFESYKWREFRWKKIPIVSVVCNLVAFPRNNFNIGHNWFIQWLTMFESKRYVPSDRAFPVTNVQSTNLSYRWHRQSKFSVHKSICLTTWQSGQTNYTTYLLNFKSQALHSKRNITKSAFAFILQSVCSALPKRSTAFRYVN